MMNLSIVIALLVMNAVLTVANYHFGNYLTSVICAFGAGLCAMRCLWHKEIKESFYR